VPVRVVDGDGVVTGARLVVDWLVVVARLAVEAGGEDQPAALTGQR
jgi:hypothetical protein